MYVHILNKMAYSEKMQTYMEALEEERRKILVFQRELPLCLELVTQAIETCKQQLSGTTTCEYNIHGGGQSECYSEQTSTEGPVLEEFIPIKRSRSRSDEDMEQEQEDENNNEMLYSHENPNKGGGGGGGGGAGGGGSISTSTCCSSRKNKSEKSDWLRSAQLWNQTPDPPSKNVGAPKRVSVVEVKRNGGAFQPFHRDRSNPATNNTNNDNTTGVEKSNQSVDKENKPQSSVHTAATSSTAETVTSGGEGGSNKNDKKGGQTQRKQRRCWSPELHRRFLQALQQLGGSHAATPKQIRELMKVDGLTNDEVKSHLQKYRLHTRRPSPTIHQPANPPPPQFVVVGGIWVPPPEYAAVTGATAPAEAAAKANGIYGPVAAPSAAVPQTSSVTQQPKPKQPESSHSEGRDSLSHNSHTHSGGGRVRCNSPSTSSSTHTSTAAPVY